MVLKGFSSFFEVVVDLAGGSCPLEGRSALEAPAALSPEQMGDVSGALKCATRCAPRPCNGSGWPSERPQGAKMLAVTA